MADREENGIVRQELNLIFIIDNSGSMSGEKLGAVNNAIRDVMSIMPEIQEDTSEAIIKIHALKFSDHASWVYNEGKTVSDFKWADLAPEGETNLSDAFDKLEKCLMKQADGGQMPDFGGVAPILILMTDGLPTSPDWEAHLNALKKRGWFKAALRYALAIFIKSDEAMNILTSFTGNPETVLQVYTAEALRKIIRVIAVTASKAKSSSTNTAVTDNNQATQQQIAQKLDEEVQDGWN